MNPAEIKKLRTESLLVELIPEALSQLGDERLHDLSVTAVVCSKGRSDAKVYLDPSIYTKEEEQRILNQLIKAKNSIEGYCKNDQGWFRCPGLSFEFDHQLERSNTVEALLAKAKAELEKKGGETH